MSVVSAPKAVATSEEKVKISLNSSEMPEINTESTGQKEREREGAFTQKLLNMNFRMLGRIKARGCFSVHDDDDELGLAGESENPCQ